MKIYLEKNIVLKIMSVKNRVMEIQNSILISLLPSYVLRLTL